MSFKHLLDGTAGSERQYNFSEIDTNLNTITTMGYTIRDAQYKLIEYNGGAQEMYDISVDSLELNDLLLGSLTVQQQNVKTDLENEAVQRQTSWSCKDDIQNGDETGIDCGGTYCTPCVVISINNLSNEEEYSVFPNPIVNSFYISSDDQPIKGIAIYNTSGTLLLTKQNLNSTFSTIDIAHLEQGHYFLKINLVDKVQMVKIIKN